MLQGTLGRNSGGELANPIPEGAGVSSKFHAVILWTAPLLRLAGTPVASLQLHLIHLLSRVPSLAPAPLLSCARAEDLDLRPQQKGAGQAWLRAFWAEQFPECFNKGLASFRIFLVLQVNQVLIKPSIGQQFALPWKGSTKKPWSILQNPVYYFQVL